VASALDDVAVGIFEVELKTTELGALATIGAASEAVLGGVTLSAVADAEGSVNEDLEFHIGNGFVDSTDVVDGQLAGKDSTRKACILEPAHLLGGAVVGLGAGMKRHTEVVVREETHVLKEYGIDADGVEVGEQLKGVGVLVVADEGVHRSIDLSAILMSETCEGGDVVDAVACLGTGAVATRSYIDGIGTVKDGCLACLQILCWCK
jgi:hypothetical protein